MFNDMCSYIGDHYYKARWYDCNAGTIVDNDTSVCGDGVWKHNLFSYDSTGIRVYENGQEISSSSTPPSITSTIGYIGSRPSFGTNGLNGYMDDLFFTSEVLDADDAILLYEQGLAGRPLRWQ